MGLGNFVVVSTEYRWASRACEELTKDNPAIETTPLQSIGDGVTRFIGSGDCAFEPICSKCNKDLCVGCREPVIVYADLEESKFVCFDCAGISPDIFREFQHRLGALALKEGATVA